MDPYQPVRSDLFTFGLWTVGNTGADPFGSAVRPRMSPPEIVRMLAECGAYGVNLHDNDLVPLGAAPAERDRILREFRESLADTGLTVPMTTTNLFTHPVFKDGAFTSNDPKVRAFALQKTLASIDLGVELGAEIYVCWGGREGSETDACRDPRDALKRMREALNFICEYMVDQGYPTRLALEAKPNEPRGDIYLATTGHMLHFIETLDHPERVGVNPEVAHETMAGLSFVHAVAQAMDAGKLFHIDLNAQRIARYDQDLRFGSEDLKQAFLLVRLLEGMRGTPRYEGPRHFDAHAYRSEDSAGVRDFAIGCMRTYKMLQARAAQFDADPEVREILAERTDERIEPLLAAYSRDGARALSELDLDPDELARPGLRYERLDQLLTEHLMGFRGP
ncbi:MAG: xylose isomerase [Planctomycetota bacterium]